MQYARNTYLTPAPGPFSCGMIAGAALCTDGAPADLPLRPPHRPRRPAQARGAARGHHEQGSPGVRARRAPRIPAGDRGTTPGGEVSRKPIFYTADAARIDEHRDGRIAIIVDNAQKGRT